VIHNAHNPRIGSGIWRPICFKKTRVLGWAQIDIYKNIESHFCSLTFYEIINKGLDLFCQDEF